MFDAGNNYSREEVKEKLTGIYKVYGIDKKVTATTIKEYFEIIEKSKRINGIKIRLIEIIKPLTE